MSRGVRAALAMFFAAVLALSVWKLCGLAGVYRKGRMHYAQLEEYVSRQESVQASGTEKDKAHKNTAVAAEAAAPLRADFEQLGSINPDVVGWIVLEGTQIHYPVVQGEDNEEYLDTLFDGAQHRAGSIFLDSRCAADFSGRHSILYGHNMKDGSMFAALMGYKEQAFYDEHPTATLLTPGGSYTVSFFAGYVADPWENAWQIEFARNEYAQWQQKAQERSCFQTEVSPSQNDRILTLSTCSYEHDEARFVLHGILKKQEE